MPELATIDTYKVDCIRLDDFIKENKITDIIDFIKIDTQGHDLNVIKSLGKYKSNVREIVCEVQTINYELYKNQSDKKELLNYMDNHGFEIKKIKPWSHNQEENIWFINKNFNKHYHLDL